MEVLNTHWYSISSPALPCRAAAPMQLAIVQWQAASAPKIAQESALHLHCLQYYYYAACKLQVLNKFFSVENLSCIVCIPQYSY